MDTFVSSIETQMSGRGGPAARAENAYNYLKLELLEGELAAGDKLSVIDIAERLDCSRVPVMEALKRLETEGFVRIVPQVGCQVVTPEIADVTDFFLLFAAVEGTVTGFAAARRSSEDIASFRQVCVEFDAMVKLAGSPEARDPAYRRLNLLFHTAIHRLARSPVASQLASSLWDRSDFYIKMVFGSLYFSKSVMRSHRAIRKAIIDGETEAAEAAVRTHLTNVGAGVVKQMSSST